LTCHRQFFDALCEQIGKGWQKTIFGRILRTTVVLKMKNASESTNGPKSMAFNQNVL
jgi:hypothetical protein